MFTAPRASEARTAPTAPTVECLRQYSSSQTETFESSHLTATETGGFFFDFLKNLFDHNFSSIKSQASKISVRFKQKENGNLKKLDGIMTRCFIPDKVDL